METLTHPAEDVGAVVSLGAANGLARHQDGAGLLVEARRDVRQLRVGVRPVPGGEGDGYCSIVETRDADSNEWLNEPESFAETQST